MASETICLVTSRSASHSRAHFSIFVPSPIDKERGSLIHVVGAPMMGYKLEFKRNYSPFLERQQFEVIPIGKVLSSNIVHSTGGEMSLDDTPKGNIEIAATRIPTPRVSPPMAPVDGVTNRRCQEWTMEYLQYLVSQGLIGAEAIQIVQSKRDPPTFGVGLRPVAQR